MDFLKYGNSPKYSNPLRSWPKYSRIGTELSIRIYVKEYPQVYGEFILQEKKELRRFGNKISAIGEPGNIKFPNRPKKPRRLRTI